MSPADFRAWLNHMGLSQREAVAKLGITRPTIAGYLREGAPPYIERACAAIAAGLPTWRPPMADGMPTINLTFDVRQRLPEGAAKPVRGRETSGSYAYEVPCPYDPERLTDRARQLLAIARSTFGDHDDLAVIFGVVRRTVSIEEAAEAFAVETAGAAETIRRRAGNLRHAYGDQGNAREEWVEWNPGAAPIEATIDATDYLNRLAATPGLAVRPEVHAPYVRIDPESVDAGVEPWRYMLTGREHPIARR